MSNYRSKVEVQRSEVKVTRNKNVKSFCAHLRQKFIDLRQTKIKMINGPFYTYRRIHFTSKNASVFWYL